MTDPTSDDLLSQFLAGEALPAHLVDANRAWREASDWWSCPGCGRTRLEIPWLSKRGRVAAKLVEHHDHIDECYFETWDDVPRNDRIILQVICNHAKVFEPTLVCECCNAIDVRTRNILQLPPGLSWAPAEIRRFIRACPHRPHEIIEGSLRAAWERRAKAELRRRHFVEWSLKALREGSHWRQLGVASLDELPGAA